MIFLKSFGIFLNSEKGRTRLALYFGLFFNIAVILFKTFTGIAYRSVWFGAMAVYYFLLSVIKFLIIRTDRKLKWIEDRETALLRSLHTFRRCGALLIVLNLIMTVVILIIVKYDKKAEYGGFVLWVFGIYTVIRSVVSAINVKNLPHTRDPLIAASRHLGISVTMMSIFSLCTVLFDMFCEDEETRRFFIAMIGAVVSVSVMTLAIRMIITSTRKIRDIGQ